MVYVHDVSVCVLIQLNEWLMVYVHDVSVCVLAQLHDWLFMMSLCVSSHSLMMSLCVSLHSFMTDCSWCLCVCPRTAWWLADGLCSWCLYVLAQLDDWLMVYVHDVSVCPHTDWWLADGLCSWCLCMCPCTTSDNKYVRITVLCDGKWCRAVWYTCTSVSFHWIMLLLFSILKMQAGCSFKTLWHTFIATQNHITIHTAVRTSDLNKHNTWNHQILDTDVPQFSNNLGVSNMVLWIFIAA